MNICAAPNCDKACGGRTLCPKHWERMRRHGSFDGQVIPCSECGQVFTKRTRTDCCSDFCRLLSKTVKRDDGCWVFIGARYGSGYGFLAIAGHNRAAHRVSYEFHVGPIPKGLHLDHLCRVRACVNPEHLEPVTPAENIRRGQAPTIIASRRTHCDEGHEFTEANTYRNPKNPNWRRCRECDRTKRRARLLKARADLLTEDAA